METLPKLPPKGELHINYLDVSHCKIKILPFGFNRLNCLSFLNISYNQLGSLCVPPEEGKEKSDISFFPHYITKLDASHNLISEVDDTMLRLKGLVTLDLSYNDLLSLPEELHKLHCLKELYLNNNMLNMLPPLIYKLPRLLTLDVSNNSITEITGVEKLPVCTKFIATHNDIVILPAEMRGMTNLVDLDVSFNKLKEIPASLGRVGSLKNLNVSNNYITVIPEELGLAQILEKLDLSNNELTQLPWELRKWRMLTHLKLSKNELSFLHKSFHTTFNQLEVLELRDNSLNEMSIPVMTRELDISNNSPHHIEKVLNKNLINLERLCISGLELAELPSHLITKYRLMQHLDISKNQLTMIPDSMIHIMKQLRHFDCSFNELSELPKELEDFKYLSYLNCSHNQLSELPDEILRCPLIHLNISNNKIKVLKLPSKKSDMDHIKPFPLIHLDISVNQFEEFQRGNLQWFGSLRYFNAQGNYMTWIHPDITCLYRLEYLNLAENDIIHLPADLNKLTRLKELNLKDNLIGDLPETICKITWLTSLDISHNKIIFFPRNWDNMRINHRIEKHYDFQRREKRDPRRHYDYNEAMFIMTGIDPSARPEKKKKKRKAKKGKAGKKKK